MPWQSKANPAEEKTKGNCEKVCQSAFLLFWGAVSGVFVDACWSLPGAFSGVLLVPFGVFLVPS